MSDRSDVFAELERFKAGYDEYDDEKISYYFSRLCERQMRRCDRRGVQALKPLTV